jgi:hypothetical protein
MGNEAQGAQRHFAGTVCDGRGTPGCNCAGLCEKTEKTPRREIDLALARAKADE